MTDTTAAPPDAAPLRELHNRASDLLAAWYPEHAPDLLSRAAQPLERAIEEALEATWDQAAATGAATAAAAMLRGLAEHYRTSTDTMGGHLRAARIDAAADLVAPR